MKRIKTGVSGIDEILHGGLLPASGTLVRGGPGTGKTTFGLHFLSEGIKNGECVLFITLGEAEENLKDNGKRVGLDTDAIHFLDLSPSSEFFSNVKSYDLFSAAEIEKNPVTKKIVEAVTVLKPDRVFLDSTSHLRYLSIDTHQFRKQLLAFIRFLLEQKATVLFTSESTISNPDDDVMYLSDAIINVSLVDQFRQIEVTKLRGSDFLAGKHTMKLSNRGYEVFPRLVPADHERVHVEGQIKSGIEEVDTLLHGGLEKGTISVLSGPAGVGKTSLGISFLKEAARTGERSVLFAFEEHVETLIVRAESIKIPVRSMIEDGNLVVINLEPLSVTADQISHFIRTEVEQNNTKIIMIDSIAGYTLAIQNREGPIADLRSLFKYLTNKGVSVIAVNETETIVGDFRATEMGISYMCDNIIFIRYLEMMGEMRKAIGILKKRMTSFERNLREFNITSDGIKVGEPLKNLRGILKGEPEWIGHEKSGLPLDP